MSVPHPSRRAVVAGGAALLVAMRAQELLSATIVEPSPLQLRDHMRSLSPDAVRAWLAVHEDGTVTAYFGMMDVGQGVDTAIAQVVAEELDIGIDRVTVIMADTAITVNQGGTGGSSACERGARPLRAAAAQARALLIARAAERLDIPPGDLAMRDGEIYRLSRPEHRLAFRQLIGTQALDSNLTWNGKYGYALNVVGAAEPKEPDQYRLVGTAVPRLDIPGKILATLEYCHHVTLPGMLHGRMVRPPVANARPVAVDKNSIVDIAGAQVVWIRDFLGVVAPSEWDAILASRQLQVEWSKTTPPFPKMERLYDHLREAPTVASNGGPAYFGKIAYDTAPTEAKLAGSARVISSDYEVPFQAHARMAPSVAVADVRDGKAVVYSDAQKTHYLAQGLAKLLLLAEGDVRVIWRHGPGSYGRSDADEAAFEAAILSQAVHRPVRVQWMRDEGHAWSPKAPPAVMTLKAGIDARGELTAWYFRARAFSGWDISYEASEPRDTLAGMLLGHEKSGTHNFGIPDRSYDFPERVMFWETCAPFLEQASPLRCSHMRAPQEPQIHFAHESFIDEVAALTGHDPIDFRLKHLNDARKIAVLKAAAKAAHWESRVSSTRRIASGSLLRGRGVAVSSFGETVVATVCEVEVDRSTGRVWPRRMVVAHDCGLIINPLGLKGVIEAGTLQALSRALCEEVQFDEDMVRSVDWESYPILDVMDVPESFEIVTIETPGVPPSGAGEGVHVGVAAALGNAVFDAAGVRFRRLPLTPQRVKAGLDASMR